MVRAHIYIDTAKNATEFVKILNSDGTADKFTIEDSTGHYRAEARSLLGVMYATCEFTDNMYLVNETNDGKFPAGIDKFRVLGK